MADNGPLKERVWAEPHRVWCWRKLWSQQGRASFDISPIFSLLELVSTLSIFGHSLTIYLHVPYRGLCTNTVDDLK